MGESGLAPDAYPFQPEPIQAGSVRVPPEPQARTGGFPADGHRAYLNLELDVPAGAEELQGFRIGKEHEAVVGD